MAMEEFFDSLRGTYRTLARPKVSSDVGRRFDFDYGPVVESADPWLTKKSVKGFDASDFEDWPEHDRASLVKEVAAFLAIAENVPADKPAKKADSNRARKHLEAVMKIVRQSVLKEWIEAQQGMMDEARSAAESDGWYADPDEKEIRESLLGVYKAPRLRLRSLDREVVLDPVVRFGSGDQGLVDLVVLRTYETAYMITYKDRSWRIASIVGKASRKPFTRETFLNTINRVPKRYA